MSEQPNMPARLREGIDAAKRGDKLTARRLLQQVLSGDGDNELALMWMASVVDTLDERRFFLERALQVNPNNNRAREALRRLGVTLPTTQRASASSPPAGDYVRRVSTGGGGTNLYLIGAAVVAIVVIAVIVAASLSSAPPPATPSSSSVQLTFAAFVNPSKTPTQASVAPTATLLPGVVVSLDSSLFTSLPPTFTPTFTLTPSITPTPTVTPLPLGSFTIVYADIEQSASVPSLYQGSADGTGEVKLQSGDSGGYTDVAYDPTGQRIAFVRTVADSSGNNIPQLFIAPLSAPQDAQQITTLTGATLAHPSWSPDGTRIVFSSDQNGTEQITSVNSDGSNLTTLSNNTGRNFDPEYSPDGSKIVYASDADSPGFTEIYVMGAYGADPAALTETPNSYSPTWSPDGTLIAYVNDQQGQGDIYVMQADGTRAVLLTTKDSDAENRTPVWSPDGHWILFASNRGGDQFRWYAIDLQGNVQPVTVTGRNPQSLAFVPH